MSHRTRIKICCISSLNEAKLATEAGADLVGLVGPMPSGPGTLTLDAATAIASPYPGEAEPILLTSSSTAEIIAKEAKRVGVTHVQVTRHIDPTEAKHLAALPLTYSQVIHVEDETALDLIDVYAPFCDMFLLDSGRPSQGTLGGTGQTHDWRISAEFVRCASKPTYLAGGLTPDNVSEAIKTVRPYGVDICSGVRRSGQLSKDLLDAFVQAIADIE